MDVRTVCLGILTLGDATGYEIKKLFEERGFSQVFDAGYGSIYPALNRLTEDGLVSCRTQAQEGRPDKKVYSLTPGGREAFVTELVKPPARDKVRSEFMLAMVFSDLLDAAQVERLIDARIAEHEDQIRELEADTGPGGPPLSPQWRFIIGYGLRFNHGAIDYLRTHRHLLVPGHGRPASAQTPAQAGAQS